MKEKFCALSNGRGLACPRLYATSIQTIPELGGMSVKKNLSGPNRTFGPAC